MYALVRNIDDVMVYNISDKIKNYFSMSVLFDVFCLKL